MQCQICGKRKWYNRVTTTSLDGPIQSMAEFFDTLIETLEKSIPPCVSLRNSRRNKKPPKKRETVTIDNEQDEVSKEEEKSKKFCKCHGMCGQTMDECMTLKTLIRQASQKKANNSKARRSTQKNLILW